MPWKCRPSATLGCHHRSMVSAVICVWIRSLEGASNAIPWCKSFYLNSRNVVMRHGMTYVIGSLWFPPTTRRDPNVFLRGSFCCHHSDDPSVCYWTPEVSGRSWNVRSATKCASFITKPAPRREAEPPEVCRTKMDRPISSCSFFLTFLVLSFALILSLATSSWGQEIQSSFRTSTPLNRNCRRSGLTESESSPVNACMF